MTSSRRYPLLLAALTGLAPAAYPSRTCFGILLGTCLNLVASIVPAVTVFSISIDTSRIAVWQWLACGLLIARISVACRPRPRGPLFDTVSGAIEVISRGPLPQPRRRVYRRKLIELLSRGALDDPGRTSLRRVAS